MPRYAHSSYDPDPIRPDDMCGLICVRSRKPVSQDLHLQALDLLGPRGPDLRAWRHQAGIFIGQTVLNFNHDIEFYQDQPLGSFFVFNGEIYGQDQDTRAIHDLVTGERWSELAESSGPWAWIWTDFEQVWWATDPQHEKHLFVYQDHDWLIITSEMLVILHYVQPQKMAYDPPSKHIPVLDRMPWTGCQRAQPGRLYRDGEIVTVIDDMTRWPRETYSGSYSQAVDDLDGLLRQVIEDMTPDRPHALTLSGGLDSGILHTYLPRAATCTALLDKDPVCQQVQATYSMPVDAKIWADAYRAVAQHIQLPVMSWSMITLYALLSQVPERAIFMGSGADELFGGYAYNLAQEVSPYSRDILPGIDNLLADFMVQTGGADVLGADLVAGMLGKEIRLPFAHPRIIRFALALPWHYKIAQATKVILRDLYQVRTGRSYDLPKQGFAGHCNDSISYLDPQFHTGSTDRLKIWRDFVLHWFQHHA